MAASGFWTQPWEKSCRCAGIFRGEEVKPAFGLSRGSVVHLGVGKVRFLVLD